MKVAFLTLGCKVNYYETEKLSESLREAGYEIIPFGEGADIYIVNTCTVTNIADRKSRQMLHRAKKKNPYATVIAIGCYVDAAKDIDEDADLAVGNRDKERLVEIIDEYLKGKDSRAETSESAGVLNPQIKKEKQQERNGAETSEKKMSAIKPRTRAFIKIQDGCSQFCSYCLIPYVRGGGVLKSKPEDEAVEEIRSIAAAGCREVVLTGIHVSSYGVDFTDEKNFVKLAGRPLVSLIQKINTIDGIERIRLSSLEPRIISEEFLEGLSTADKLCPHFHLSLQSGCDDTLKRMNRHYTTDDYRERVDLLRERYDSPAITTDVIVGFPGETDEEFDITRKFIEEIRFSNLHVFQYSVREGTRAATMPKQISSEVKKRRSAELLSVAERLSSEYADGFRDKSQKVLFEEFTEVDGEKYITGYNESYVRFGVRADIAEALALKGGEIKEVEAGSLHILGVG